MNTQLVVSTLSTFCLLLSTAALGQTLVEDANVDLFAPPASGSPFLFAQISQDPAGTDDTGIEFSVAAGPSVGLATLTFENVLLDSGSDWYLAEFGDVFSTQSIANGTHEIWGGFAPDGSGILGGEIDVPVGDFFLGVATSITGTRDVFGWAQFNIDDQLNVTLIDNAVAYQSNQILIGQNAIPEPSSAVLLFAMTVGTTLRRSRKT